jgi:pyruvate/2-oxoglutarate dehydrogenase complex dihydrolipoamide dehydrogenase (E3) component
MPNAPQLLQPWDSHNQALAANVHPADWVNPEPAPRYNLVVIGGGPAGLVIAAGAAGLGAKVALVEKHLLGGDCLNVGCIPSKALLRSARAASDARSAHTYGVRLEGEVKVDFGAVMERMRRLRASLSPHDSAKRFRDLGVDVFLGAASFADAQTIQVGDQQLKFKRAVIATGASAKKPDVDGLGSIGCLTNETIFSLTQLPRRLAVIGGGPLGCELAQAFRRLGSEVVLLHSHAQLLSREDADVATILQNRFLREGLRLELGCVLKNVARGPSGGKVVNFEGKGRSGSVTVDEILAGTGRQPNVQGLGLERAGVTFDATSGIHVNDQLQTTNPRIYAAGDVCMDWKFTHAADAAARIVIQNALFLGRKRLSALNMPWCTYTEPEIAHLGLYEQDARARHIKTDTYLRPFDQVDRAVVEGETEGFVRILTVKGSDRILGATIVGPHAGEMISEVSVAMAGKVGLGRLARVLHPYPTHGDAIRQLGDAYNRTRLTPSVKNTFSKWLAWTR